MQAPKNLFQTLNIGFFLLTVSAALLGLARIEDLLEAPLNLWLFVAFYMLLRIKTCLDDHDYFGWAQTSTVHFKVGFIVAVFSWLPWTMSGYLVSDLPTAYLLLCIAIGVSTVWILVDALRKGALKEQYYWLGANSLYMMLLAVLIYQAYQGVPQDQMSNTVLVTSLLLIAVVDFYLSGSFEQSHESDPRG